jgi:hypothetical protein
MFGALSEFSRRIKGMITLQLQQVWTWNVTSPLPAAPVTNWEPPGVTLAGYCWQKARDECSDHGFVS